MYGEHKILVPKTFNDGKDTEFERGIFGDVLIKLFGGLTVGPEMSGYWVDANNKLVKDIVIPHYVASDDENKVREAARCACDLFDQDCVYLRLANGAVEFIAVDKEKIAA